MFYNCHYYTLCYAECCELSDGCGIEYNARNNNWKFIFNTYRTILYNLDYSSNFLQMRTGSLGIFK